jgi:hypothetical protein
LLVGRAMSPGADPSIQVLTSIEQKLSRVGTIEQLGRT